MNSQDILTELAQVIHQTDPKAEVFLFGSRARGNNRPDSDWDILILVDQDKVTNAMEDSFRVGIYDIELASGQIISTFIYPKSFWKTALSFTPLYNQVEKEGIKI